MEELKNRLELLCVFRELLSDSVISALLRYLEVPTSPAYAGFVAELYRANGGNLSEYVRALCENSENVYVKTIGRGEQAPVHLYRALLKELQTLQDVASLTFEELCKPLSSLGYLPEFATSEMDLPRSYLHRTENIGKYGYGIYAKHRMFCVDSQNRIVPVRNPDRIQLSQLIDYERERRIILDNTKALLAGKPAANILLTGDAGTGKSSTVKAVCNALWDEGLRIIELRRDQLHAIPPVLDTLAENPLKFILFIDDLSFLKDDDDFNALKAILEGSVTAKSGNVVVYATSNRRHIVKEKFSDREGDEVHRNDTIQELISLSERFGIHVTFSKPDKKTFLHIVRHLAGESSLRMPEEELELLAERFALERGGRSARLARQFVDNLLARPSDENV